MAQPELYQQMVEAIAGGRAILIVGAGVSARLKYPLWGKLLDLLGEEAIAAALNETAKQRLRNLASNSDVMARAQDYQDALGPTYLRKRLVEIYGPEHPPCDSLQEDLIRLPFRQYLTTNYDRCLETAYRNVKTSEPRTFDFQDWKAREAFLHALTAPESIPQIVHVHGSICDAGGLVLTLDDYNRRYQTENWAVETLKQVFGAFCCIFVGFSLSDLDFLLPHRLLSAISGNTPSRHFAIVSAPNTLKPPYESEEATASRLRRLYKIEPLFYEYSASHSSLQPYIAKLLHDVTHLPRSRINAVLVEDAERIIALAISENLPSVEPSIAQQMASDAARRLVEPSWIFQPIYRSSTGKPELSNDERTPLDLEIEATFRFVDQGRPEVAIELYRQMLGRSETVLTNRLRYRLHANIGSGYYSMGDHESAAREYLIAAALVDNRDGRGFEAMAYMLRKDYQKALELSRKLIGDEPDFPKAYWLMLSSVPSTTTFDEAEAVVPAELRQHSEIAIALGGLASERELPDKAEQYARLALKGAPDWPEAKLNIAASVLMSEKRAATIDIGHGLVPRSPERVREAENLLTEVIAQLRSADPAHRLHGAFFNRASARRFLGRFDEADDDTREAYRQKPGDPETAIAIALVKDRAGDSEGAIAVLRSVPALVDHPRVSMVLAHFLDRRGKTGDRDAALETLAPWLIRFDQIAPTVAIEILEQAIEINLRAGNTKAATDLSVSAPESLFSPGARDIKRGEILIEAGDEKGAIEALKTGVARLQLDGNWWAIRAAAILAFRLKAHEIALPLWKHVVKPVYFNDDTGRFLRTAHILKDDDCILKFCAALRRNGIINRRAFEYEIDALMRCHEPYQAKALLIEWLRDHPEDSEARLQLSALAAQRGEDELIETDPARLPPVKAVRDAEMGRLVVFTLARGPEPQVAALYAYDLWRRFPDQEAAQLALIGVVLYPFHKRIKFEQPLRVNSSAAVRYREVSSKETSIVVVEQGDSPSATRSEYPPNHPLVMAMWDKSPGETFQLNGREYMVVAISNKIVHRAHDCLNGFEEIFPESRTIRRLKVSETPETEKDIRKALGEVWTMLEADESRRRQLETIYRQGPFPIPLLAKKLGRPLLDTMAYLAGNAELGIRCCTSGQDIWDRALGLVTQAREVVLDGTAIATWYMLGLHHRISDLPFKCVIPDSAMQEIRESIGPFKQYGRERLLLGVQNDNPVVQEVPEEYELARVAALEGLIKALEAQCEVVGGSAITELRPDQRDQLVTALGPGVADAIAIARSKQLPLWTDDYATGTMVGNEWSIPRIWTEVVLKALPDTAGEERSSNLIGRLFSWGYDFVRLSPGAVVDLFSQCGWDARSALGTLTLKYVATYGAMNPSNCVLTQVLITMIWFRCPRERTAKRLIVDLLQHIGRPVSGRLIARKVYRMPFAAFPLRSRKRFNKLKRFLRKWRSTAPGTLHW